ncbi:T9SS type A sorting domain-containing protein [Epilithonimonas sp.]|uniref:T9SS type A sorting domain-containing protein n=1 Tax=Epilithonimonas sp. TaxID=2894511 RepID=UPI002FDCF86F
MKKLYFLSLVIFGIFTYAQETSLNLKSLHQVNTYNGGEVFKTVFDDNQNNITVGYANGEFSLGNETIPTTNTNTLFVLKSDNQVGQKIWLKTITPSSKGSIKPYLVYSKSNQTYIVFNFKGSVTLNNSTYNSTEKDWVIIKMDDNGNVLWSNSVEPMTLKKHFDVSIQNGNAFFLINNKIFRFNDVTGELISSFYNSDFTLTSLEVKDQSLYFAGNSYAGINIGSESLKKGSFILKSDLDYNVNSSLQFYETTLSAANNIIVDIEILTDGSLSFAGLSSKKIKAYGENGLVEDCNYNMDQDFSNLFAGRTSADFTNIYWLAGNMINISSPISHNIKLYHLPNKNLYFYYSPAKGNSPTIQFFNSSQSRKVIGSTLLHYGENGYAIGGYPNYIGTFSESEFDFKLINNKAFVSDGNMTNTSVYEVKNINSYENNFTKNIISKKGVISSNAFKAMSDGSFYNGVVTQNNVSDYFGNNVSNLSDNSYTQVFSKISSTGNLEWKTSIKGIEALPSSLYGFNKTNYIDTDGNITSLSRCSYDNNCILSKNNSLQTIPNSFGRVIITNIDSQGEVNWIKLMNINSYNYTVAEHNGYHYILGVDQGLIEIDNVKYGIEDGYVHMSFFLIKIANNGEIKFVKHFYNNTDIYEANLSFDENDNIYGFLEPLVWEPETIDHYKFGNISIPSNSQKSDLLMVKFDSEGNPLFGKNFYENLPQDYSGGWFNDFRYNGNDFIAYGASIKNPDNTYYGVDGQIHSTPNDAGTVNNFVTKISKQGDIIWETPIFSKTFNYSKINIDSSSNTYVFGTWMEKLNIQNLNFNLSPYDFSVNLLKLDNNGNIKYAKELYTAPRGSGSTPSNLEISVLSNSKIALAGNTLGNNLLNGDINNLNGDNYYIAVLEEEVLATNDVDKNNTLKIYPNPTSDFLTLNTKEKINNFEIYDSSGKKVNGELNSNNQIDVSKLLKGVYYIRILTGKDSWTSKFIKK